MANEIQEIHNCLLVLYQEDYADAFYDIWCCSDTQYM